MNTTKRPASDPSTCIHRWYGPLDGPDDGDRIWCVLCKFSWLVDDGPWPSAGTFSPPEIDE